LLDSKTKTNSKEIVLPNLNNLYTNIIESNNLNIDITKYKKIKITNTKTDINRKIIKGYKMDDFMDKFSDIELKKSQKREIKQKQEIIEKHGEEFYKQINKVAEKIAFDFTYKNKEK
jgi:hypothetical protein